jgi:predicted PurR-regulated permease PerM
VSEPLIAKRWQRPLFFAVTFLIVVAVIVAAEAVMLPFVLALVIAYVLTPLVAWVE